MGSARHHPLVPRPQALPWLWVKSAAVLEHDLPGAVSRWLRQGAGGGGLRFELAQTVVFVLLLLVSMAGLIQFLSRGSGFIPPHP